MVEPDDRRYFIVKHDLESFQRLPGHIWRTDKPRTEEPKDFKSIRKGDLWIAFAYIENDNETSRIPLSQVVGFYECVEPKQYGKLPQLPQKVSTEYPECQMAWFIRGEKCDTQPESPVEIPPITRIIGKRLFQQQTITKIKAEDFEKIKSETFKWEKKWKECLPRVPLFKRRLSCEQELLCAVAFGHRELGIEKIISVHTGFPDLCVKMDGVAMNVHLELEKYASGFRDHLDDPRLKEGRFEGADVGILCWVDDLEEKEDDTIRKSVCGRVYELASLLAKDGKIPWDNAKSTEIIAKSSLLTPGAAPGW